MAPNFLGLFSRVICYHLHGNMILAMSSLEGWHGNYLDAGATGSDLLTKSGDLVSLHVGLSHLT